MSVGRKRKPVAEVKSALVSTFVDIPTKATLDQFAREDDSSTSRILRLAIADYIESRKKRAKAA